MYLLDTNTCIVAINTRPQGTLNTILEKSREGLFVSSLTVAELEYGVANSVHPERNRVALIKFLSIFHILNFDDSDAVRYGPMKATLKKTGKLFGPIDMLLAAQALSKGLVFVTNNTAEFSHVEGLLLEDWKASEAAGNASPDI
jgi:tRNA(fMet)-specific endonuclease VapC